MVSVLVKIFGTEHLELAEDVVQEALISALESWKMRGIPENPRAWLYRVAKNKAIDIIRKQKHFHSFDFSDPSLQLLTSEYTLSLTMDSFWEKEQVHDDFLGMMYACCHPEISPENQVTLILKSLCGFSTKEVAKAFLTSEDTISKRLYRTKEFFRKCKIKPKIPDQENIQPRTSVVLSAIYLLFNEGYNSTLSTKLIREDLISQSMSLCRSLTQHPKTRLPKVYALMALMCFHAARSKSRLSPDGELISLEHQDRQKWDQELIHKGNDYLNQSAFGNVISTYHLEAAIAYEYCTAATLELTNWTKILSCYERLLQIHFDPVVFLNRCIVFMKLNGPELAYQELITLQGNQKLKKYYLYYATLGEMHRQMNHYEDAIHCYKKALEMTLSRPERSFLVNKIRGLEN